MIYFLPVKKFDWNLYLLLFSFREKDNVGESERSTVNNNDVCVMEIYFRRDNINVV